MSLAEVPILCSFFCVFFCDLGCLYGVVIALAGADAQGGLNGDNKNLTIANAARLRGSGDCFNNAVGKAVFNHNLKLYLRKEVDDILGAAI
jgi:hypothetical protein